MEEIYNMLSSSARINKSKRRKTTQQHQNRPGYNDGTTNKIPVIHPHIHRTTLDSSSDDDDASSRSNGSNSDDEELATTASADQNGETTKKSKKKQKVHSVSKVQQIHREEVAAFRNKLKIYLSNSNRHDASIPDPITTFGDLVCPPWWSSSNGSGTAGSNDGSSGKKKKVEEEEGGEDATFRSLRSTIVRNIESGKWINPTPIQMQSIPSLLARRDVLGCAPTGSGKSGAFIIPSLFLSSVDDEIFYRTSSSSSSHSQPTPKSKDSSAPASSSLGKIRALLLAPSRELACQLHREVERLGVGKFRGLKSALLSKANAGNLCASSGGRGLDVLVSTPLRLVECIEKGEEHGRKLDLGSVRIVVLDEADRLLDASDGSETSRPRNDDHERQPERQQQQQQSRVKTFLTQIDTILSSVPPTATRALFSATIGSSVRSLSESILRDFVDVSIGTHRVRGNNNANAASGISDNIHQSLQFVGREEGKLLAIRQIVAEGLTPPAIVFLQSKERAQALYLELMYDERMRVDVIHAGKSQAMRDRAVARFRGGETWVLICTDLCARGLDFKAVNMVINYDLPMDGVSYVHRIGRCGRAGRKGKAVTLFTEADFGHLRGIANVMKLSGCDVPAWMLTLKNSSGRYGGGGHGGGHGGSRRVRANGKMPIKRPNIDTTPKYDRIKRGKRKQHIQQSKGDSK